LTTKEIAMLKDLVLKNRSYRRFNQSVPIGMETLRELVDLARCSPSAANRQPLKYFLSNQPARNAAIFPHLSWAGYLNDWPGPGEGERPSAYIGILLDKEIAQNPFCDQGIAAQTILLGAVERGLGGCIIASIQREGLIRTLALPERYEILLVLALGKPVEEVTLDPIDPDGDVRYWRDEHQVHHVPKRALEEIILQ
jgi:nitroreductase